MELPARVRDQLIFLLDDYLETVNDCPEAGELAEFVIETFESVADDNRVDDAEELIGNLEEEAALDDPLIDTLEYEFAHNEELELTGEEIVSLVDRICAIEWTPLPDEEEDDDFF